MSNSTNTLLCTADYGAVPTTDDDDEDFAEGIEYIGGAQTEPELERSMNSNLENHDGATTSIPLCRFYKYGMCRFGDLCRFRHTTNGNGNDDGNNENDENVLEQLPRPTVSDNQNTEHRCVGPNIAPMKTSTLTQPLTPKPPHYLNDWAMAPIFVPQTQYISNQHNYECPGPNRQSDSTEAAVSSIKQQQQPTENQPKSYAEVVGKPRDDGPCDEAIICGPNGRPLCPYIRERKAGCRYGDTCAYDHGLMCELCGIFCLHPTDPVQRKIHHNACIKQHEADMEISFAIARSKDKTCGVCFEIIMKKSGREQRFGILPNCNHIFCLECIRKWRKAKQFDSKIIRACPECRVTSDFVCPSAFWVESKEDKEKLIVDYRKALSEKDCKYFKQGQGQCPFGNKCFYKHALPNGRKIDVGAPQRQVRRHNHLGEVDVLQLFLWDYLDDRDQQWLDELASILSDEGIDDYDLLA